MTESRPRPLGAGLETTCPGIGTRASARTSQRGLSMPGFLVIAGTVVFIATFAFKIAPSYFENMTINKIVSDKMADDSLRSLPPGKIYSALNQAYDMNNLYGLRAEDTIELKRDKRGGHLMVIRYEKRANLFANVDVVTRFEKEMTR